jgi:type II secretory pathway component GspD/PulD (secretin)
VATQGVESTLTTNEDTAITIFQSASNTTVNYTTGSIKTGVSLKVLAQHVGESFVTMKINPEVRGISGLSASRGGTLQPIQTLRSANTTVTMGDGETLVIGGLYTNSHLTEKAKTPLLSEIPLLGALFTRTRETKAKTELVILLTPHIVRKTADLKIITPPGELERLESTEPDGYCPAGPHLPPLTGAPLPWRGGGKKPAEPK